MSAPSVEVPQSAFSLRQSRRRFLASSVLAGLSLPFVSGCRPGKIDGLIHSLGWIPDVEYADLWVAEEKGYFAAEGVRLKVWPGGPNAPQPLIEVAARQSNVGEAEWLPFLDTVHLGNDFVLIASIYPIHPGGLMSLARRPIRTPADLSGARFLVQGPNERTNIQAIFKLNHLQPNYELVPVGFSPDALLNGAGDAYYCFITNQPMVLEDMGMKQGVDFFVTRLDQLGYKVPGTLIFTQRETIRTRRAELVGYLKARLRGMKENTRNPGYAATLAVDKYGADLGLNLKQQMRTNELQIPLYQAPGTRGPFAISPQEMLGPMYEAAAASGRMNLPDPSQILDMTLLEEAYRALGM